MRINKVLNIIAKILTKNIRMPKALSDDFMADIYIKCKNRQNQSMRL